ncbi:hypothetical protein SAMN05216197_12335 [Pseudomonas graminis]|nr:hypothetical protein SAMN05216197_12335 [Pseudomonas graminis]
MHPRMYWLMGLGLSLGMASTVAQAASEIAQL